MRRWEGEAVTIREYQKRRKQAKAVDRCGANPCGYELPPEEAAFYRNAFESGGWHNVGKGNDGKNA